MDQRVSETLSADGPSCRSFVQGLISPEQLADILDVAEDGIISIDAAQRIVLFNRGAARLFGYEPAEVLGQDLNILLPEAYHASHPREIAAFAQSPETTRRMAARRLVHGRRKDGSVFPAEVTIAKVHRGQQLLMIAIVRDAEERYRYEEGLRRLNAELEEQVRARTAELAASHEQLVHKTEELQQTTRQLWQAARLAAVGELAASIAHELNNPLGTISLRLEGVLAKTPADDPRRRALEIIEGEVERMCQLVASLLQFSRPGSNQVSTVVLAEEIDKTLELFSHHLRKRQIRIVREYAPDLPHLWADRQQLRQVFLNLFSNAADAMPHGGCLTLRLRRGNLPDGQAGVAIEVIDTGVGIPPEHLPHVFDPFFTTKEEGKGTGLGLPICKRIVEQHQGRLEIASRPGEGTTVRILLPLRNESPSKGC